MTGLGGVEPTTGAPYADDYAVPPGCTGYYREDADWGDVLTHDPGREPCPVHWPKPSLITVDPPLTDARLHWMYGQAVALKADQDLRDAFKIVNPGA